MNTITPVTDRIYTSIKTADIVDNITNTLHNTLMTLMQNTVDVLEEEDFDVTYSYAFMGEDPDVTIQLWPYSITYRFEPGLCLLWHHGFEKPSGRWEMTPSQYVALCRSYRLLYWEGKCDA